MTFATDAANVGRSKKEPPQRDKQGENRIQIVVLNPEVHRPWKTARRARSRQIEVWGVIDSIERAVPTPQIEVFCANH
jgi:hypothetical protein